MRSKSGTKEKSEQITERLELLSFYSFFLYVFLLPLQVTTAITETAFYLSAVVLIFTRLFERRKLIFYVPLVIPLGLFGIWALISVFFALDKQHSIDDFLGHFVKYIMLYLMFINLIKTRKRITLFVWAIVISTSLFSVAALVNGIQPAHNYQVHRLTFSIGETPINLFGVTALFAIASIIRLFMDDGRRSVRVLLTIIALPIFMTIILIQTRSDFLAMILCVPVLFYRYKKTIVASIVILLIIVAISPVKSRLFNMKSVNHRIQYIMVAKEIISDHPIIGIGFGISTSHSNKSIDIAKYNDRVSPDYRLAGSEVCPHNMFVSVAMRMGVPGLIFFCTLLVIDFYMLIQLILSSNSRYIKNWAAFTLSVFIMFFIKGNLEPVFSTIPETFFFIMLSMTALLWRMDKEIKTGKQLPYNTMPT